MNDSFISVRYAKALFQLAEQKAMLDQVKTEMDDILFLAKSLPEYNVIVQSPIIKSKDKQNFILQLLGNKVSDITTSLLQLVFVNSRESYLTMIARDYLSNYHAKSGVKAAQFTSAVAVDREVLIQINDIIAKKYDAKVELTSYVDPSLIGGFLLQVDDQLVDATVYSQIKMLRQRFVKTK